MKKTLCTFLTVLITTMFLSTTTFAANPSNIEIEYLDNGSYIVTSIEELVDESEMSLYSTTTTKSKTATYYNAENVAKWYVKVTGTFTYGNGTSKCINSSVAAESYATTWKITSKSASKSGNTASANAIAKQYFDGTVVKTINRTVTLTCSPTGEFS